MRFGCGFGVRGRKARRRCGNVEIAAFAISKVGGRRWETRWRTALTRNVSREFSTVVRRPAFPQRSPVLSCGFLPMQTGEELALGFLHFGGGLGVGFGVGPLRQLIDGEIVC